MRPDEKGTTVKAAPHDSRQEVNGKASARVRRRRKAISELPTTTTDVRDAARAGYLSAADAEEIIERGDRLW